MSYHETIKDATGYDELLAGSEIAILTKNVTLKQVIALTMYSRFLLAPEWADDWALIKTKG